MHVLSLGLRQGSADFQSAVSQGFQPAGLGDNLSRPSDAVPCRWEIGDAAGWKPALPGGIADHSSGFLSLPRMRRGGTVRPLFEVRSSCNATSSLRSPSWNRQLFGPAFAVFLGAHFGDGWEYNRWRFDEYSQEIQYDQESLSFHETLYPSGDGRIGAHGVRRPDKRDLVRYASNCSRGLCNDCIRVRQPTRLTRQLRSRRRPLYSLPGRLGEEPDTCRWIRCVRFTGYQRHSRAPTLRSLERKEGGFQHGSRRAALSVRLQHGELLAALRDHQFHRSGIRSDNLEGPESTNQFQQHLADLRHGRSHHLHK